MREQMPIYHAEPKSIQLRPELTRIQENPYSKIEDIFMAENTNTEGPQKPPEASSEKANEVNKEESKGNDKSKKGEEGESSEEAVRQAHQAIQEQARQAGKGQKETSKGKTLENLEKKIKSGQVKKEDYDKLLKKSAEELGLTGQELEEFQKQGKKILSEAEDASKKAREQWDEAFRGQTVPPEQRETIEKFIAMGKGPIAGGQEISFKIDTSELSGDVLTAAENINAYLERIGPNVDFLEARYAEVMQMKVNEDQKKKLLEKLLEKIQQARKVQKAEMEEARKKHREQGLYGERKLTGDEKDKIISGDDETIEFIFNRMFDRVSNSPHVQFKEAFGTAGSLEWDELKRTFSEGLRQPDTALAKKAQENITAYEAEMKLREIAHDANYGVVVNTSIENLSNFIQPIETVLVDLAYSKKGVAAASRFWEQSLLKAREQLGGFLTTEIVDGSPVTKQRGQVEEDTRELLQRAIDSKMLKDEKGNVIEKMESWEIDRAISLARGLGIIMGRTVEIASQSILPPEQKLVSLYAQDLIKVFNPFRHGVAKFNAGEKRNRALAFKLKRKRWPWSYKELEEFDVDKELNVVNGLCEDKDARFMSVANPFKTGGLFSKSTWRLGEDEILGALSHFGDQSKIEVKKGGTGVWIERERNNLSSPDSAKRENAEKTIKAQLDKIGKTQPLKIFFNFREVREKVLKELGIADMNKDPQFQNDINSLILLQEKAVNTESESLDFDSLSDGDPERVKRLAKSITSKFTKEVKDKFMEDLKDRDWKIPFNLGTDDALFDKFTFAKTGPTSLARRWRDIKAENDAVTGLGEYLEGMTIYQDQDQIVEALYKVYKAMTNYDGGAARDMVTKLSEGAIKYFGKKWSARLPFGIGTAVSMGGRASFAQSAHGRHSMAWDELEIYEFRKKLYTRGMINHEQEKELVKKAGGGVKEVIVHAFRTWGMLAVLALLFYSATRVAKGQK